MRIIIGLLFLVIVSSVSAQLSDANKALLRTELAERVNELRVSLGREPLLFNDTLQKAAELHSIYMAKYNLLTHDEKKSSLATPYKRVRKMKGKDFELVGENILESRAVDFPLSKKEVIALAESMFNSWKKSPPHYANMIDPEYTYGDFGFAERDKTNKVFATQVFGKKGVEIPNQLSNNSFGLKKAYRDCSGVFAEAQNAIVNVGNSLAVEGNEIVLYHHSAEFIAQLFSGPRDGIAIDLISRDQLACNVPNQMDLSPVHDGILLKPVFRDELLANNRAEGDYRLVTPIATIPDNLGESEYSPAIVLIQNGQVCYYNYPAFVDAARYELRPIEPTLTNPEVKLIKKGIVHSQQLDYTFATDVVTPIKLPKVKKYPNKVHSVYIASYSSIQGDYWNNEYLHNGRAISIKGHVMSSTNAASSTFVIDGKENWEKMFFQLNYHFADTLVNWPKDSLKALVVSGDTTLPWEGLLFDQRRSTAIIHYEGTYPEDAPREDLLSMNIRTAIATNNMSLANKAMFELYQLDPKLSKVLFEEYIFDALKRHPELVQNSAALLSHTLESNVDLAAVFVYTWMLRTDELNDDARANLLHLYSMISDFLIDRWDVSAQRLSNVIHPHKINAITPSNLSSELMLNLHLTYIQYFGQINDSPNIHKSFEFIADYFSDHALSIDDQIDLSLFFNSWSMYHMTEEFLLPKFNAGNLNEEATFLLARTINRMKTAANDEEIVKIHTELARMNKKAWCSWLNDEFQLLRDHKIKRIYCAECE
ncbi:MAG: CAP domain-containing protein [Crocinitomicaceae bacterium]|nr:CAP domain-containing protein [Crocinitomicaceae bacterium]